MLKRLKITARGKIKRRSAGTNHFNAREGGGITRRKRLEKPMSKSSVKEIKSLVPYETISV